MADEDLGQEPLGREACSSKRSTPNSLQHVCKVLVALPLLYLTGGGSHVQGSKKEDAVLVFHDPDVCPFNEEHMPHAANQPNSPTWVQKALDCQHSPTGLAKHLRNPQ